MRWPWSKDHPMKATDRNASKEVLDPAIEEVSKAQQHLARINRMLQEAKNAEQLAQSRRR